ncbi:DUF418 domain-containing protein [Agrobacterium salinitolerans]
MSTPLADRQVLVDALRGFALLGILVVNIMAFASPFYGSGVVDPNFQSGIDNGVRFAISLLFETKFYLLFSFLFGYSFTIQMRSAERVGKAFAPRLLRRQTCLWLIGFLHAALLFYGDILTTYAVLGLLLLLIRHQRNKRLIRIAIALIVVAAALWAGVSILAAFNTGGPDPSVTILAESAAKLLAYRDSPATVVSQNLYELTHIWVLTGLVQGPTALAMFLFGLVAGRRGLLADGEHDEPLFRRLLVASITIGLPGAILYASASVHLAGSPWELLALALSILTAPLLTAGYMVGMRVWFGTTTGQRAARLLAPAGRMALSNYLMQSFICAIIFYAYGFRLMGQVSPLAGLLLSIAIFAAQLVVSRWWMAHFAYGPFEWLLRAVTNLHIPRMRKRGSGAE